MVYITLIIWIYYMFNILNIVYQGKIFTTKDHRLLWIKITRINITIFNI